MAEQHRRYDTRTSVREGHAAEDRATSTAQPGPRPSAREPAVPGDDWNARRVRELRAHLGVTQTELADLLGTRQQTISEWERGGSSPRRMSRRLLRLVAEEHGFYVVTAGPAQDDGRAGDRPAAQTAPGLGGPER